MTDARLESDGKIIIASGCLRRSFSPQGRDASDQHIIEVVLKMLQGEHLDLSIHFRCLQGRLD